MKRIAALVLAMTLLATQSAPACAAVRPLRFLVNDNGETSAWLKEHYPKFLMKTCISTMITLAENTTA